MRIEIQLDKVKPISINSTYYSTGHGFVKTTSAREWTNEICYHLSSPDNERKLEQLRNYFNPELHYFKVELEVKYPKSVFKTKKGTISSKTIDITNWEKALIDVIFLSKNYSETPPYGCKNLNTDDKYICEMTSRKSCSDTDDYCIKVALEIALL